MTLSSRPGGITPLGPPPTFCSAEECDGLASEGDPPGLCRSHRETILLQRSRAARLTVTVRQILSKLPPDALVRPRGAEEPVTPDVLLGESHPVLDHPAIRVGGVGIALLSPDGSARYPVWATVRTRRRRDLEGLGLHLLDNAGWRPK